MGGRHSTKRGASWPQKASTSVINRRDADKLKRAVAELGAANDVEVTGVAADITTAEERTALLEAARSPNSWQ